MSPELQSGSAASAGAAVLALDDRFKAAVRSSPGGRKGWGPPGACPAPPPPPRSAAAAPPASARSVSVRDQRHIAIEHQTSPSKPAAPAAPPSPHGRCRAASSAPRFPPGPPRPRPRPCRVPPRRCCAPVPAPQPPPAHAPTIGRLAMVCSTLGSADFMRVPWPAAKTRTARRLSVMAARGLEKRGDIISTVSCGLNLS